MHRRVRRNISSNCTASADTKLQLVTTKILPCINANTVSYSICNQHTATSSYAFCFIVPWISKIVFHDLLYDDAFFQKQQPTNHFTWDFFLCKMCGFRQMGQRMAILCFDQCYIHCIGNILGLKNHTSP